MRTVHYYPQLDSSNRLAKELAHQQVESGTVVCAGQQSAGRGQYERAFASPLGGLYFSLILYPAIRAEDVSMITLAAGLGCRDALVECCRLKPLIKWPNDLYCSGKKLAGILTEYCQALTPEQASAVVIGAGINVNSRATDFPGELRGILGTVRDCTGGSTFDLDRLLEACAADIERRVMQLAQERPRFLADWQEADYLFGHDVCHYQKEKLLVTGVGQGLDERGRYLLRLDDGRISPVLGGQLCPL